MLDKDISQLRNELKQIKDLHIKIRNIHEYVYDEHVPKGAEVFNLKCSVKFVDIRNSTDMTDDNGRKNMVKIYKMFAKLVIKAVENNDGKVNQIMGDGMLCTFIDGDIPSGAKAINAAMEINTYLSEAYNPIVEESWKISCGIGIRTGHVYLNRIGTRGRNKTCKVAYPSSITNYACKLCNIAEGGTILFDETTYNQIKDRELKKMASVVYKAYLGKCKSVEGTIWSIDNNG